MSANIKITEGNLAKGFTADKLRVLLEVGGYELLVPESAVGLGELRATVNRRYRASEDGLFAYSVVKTDVPDGRSVTGKGPDGKKYKVTVDDGGNIVETPDSSGDAVRIAVTTPPNVTTYAEGAYLGFDGIVVTAYDQDDNSLGVVPFSELIFPVTVAVYDEDDGAVKIYRTANGMPDSAHVIQPVGTMALSDVPAPTIDQGFYPFVTMGDVVYGVAGKEYRAQDQKWLYAGAFLASKEPFSYGTSQIFSSAYKEVLGKPVHYTGQGWTNWTTTPWLNNFMYTMPVYDRSIMPASEYLAYVMLYGDIDYTDGGTQIPVQWERPGDGTILETTFGITVVPVNAGGQGDD